MAGIFGYEIYSGEFDETDITSCLIQNAQKGFSHPSKNYSFNNGKGAIGFALPYCNLSWPLKSDDDKYYFQLFGEIILPEGSILTGQNFQREFLRPLLKSRNDFVQKLNGAFVFSLYNKFLWVLILFVILIMHKFLLNICV